MWFIAENGRHCDLARPQINVLPFFTMLGVKINVLPFLFLLCLARLLYAEQCGPALHGRHSCAGQTCTPLTCDVTTRLDKERRAPSQERSDATNRSVAVPRCHDDGAALALGRGGPAARRRRVFFRRGSHAETHLWSIAETALAKMRGPKAPAGRGFLGDEDGL